MPYEERKKYKDLEKITKGYASHRRIEILELLYKTPNLSVFDIAQYLGINFRTASDHTRRLVASDLIKKHHEGASVRHEVSGLGLQVLKFLKTLK